MKKKTISLILLAVLCVSFVPTALAKDLSEPVCLCEIPCTEGAFLADCPVCSAEGAQPADCAGHTDPEENADTDDAAEEDAPSTSPSEILPVEATPAPEAPAPTAADVQALIDALPAPESITVENRTEAESQLSAVDNAKLALSDDDLATLDFTRYEAAVDALNTLDNAPGASEPQLLAQNATKDNLSSLLDDGYAEIQLSEDISNFNSSITVGGSGTITLDLNGHTLSNADITFLPNSDQLHLKITNSQSTGKIEDTTIRFNRGYGEISGVTANAVSLVADGATVNFSPKSDSGANNTINATGGSHITVNSGSFSSVYVEQEQNGATNKSEIKITGGTFTNAVNMKGTATITGGTFNCGVQMSGDGSVSGGTFNFSFQGNGVSVSGGTFNGTATLANSTVTGGTFADINANGTSLYKILGSGYAFVDASNNPMDASFATGLENVHVVESGFSLSVTTPIPNVVVGTSTTLTATISGNTTEGVTYTWYSKLYNYSSPSQYTIMDGKTGSSITINPTNAGSYFYVVVAKDSRGFTAAAETYAYYVTFEINTAPTAIPNLSYTGSPQTLIKEGTATLGAKIHYSLSKDGVFSTTLPQAENAGTYTVYYYAELNGSQTATQSLDVTVAPCDPASYNAYAQCNNFTYGDYKEPAVTDKGNLTAIWSKASSAVTYYWNRENSNTGGTKWSEAAIRALDAGTYYIYAVFAETQNFKAYTTAAKEFIINKATPDPGITAISNLTYDRQSHRLVTQEDLSSRGYAVEILEYGTGNSGIPYTLDESGLPCGTNAGSYSIQYSIAESKNYKARSGSVGVQISKIKISETTLEYTYGDSDLTNNYDSNGTGYLAVSKVDGILPGDEVNATGTLGVKLYNLDANAGTRRLTVVASRVTLSGKDCGNYEYARPAAATLIINPKLITIKQVTVQDKDYDGTTDKNVNVTYVAFNGLVNRDSLDGRYTATAVFNSAEPNSNIPVTVTVTLNSNVKNYVLESTQFVTKASITKREITGISGVSVSKTYDGTTIAVPDFSNATFDELLPAHEGKLSAVADNGTFPSSSVGTYDNIQIRNTRLTGEAEKYYQLTSSAVTTSGSITPKAVTVSKLRAADKAYDGTTAAVIDWTDAEISGIIGNDAVYVASVEGAFVDKNVVENNRVSLSKITLGGEDKNNYTLAAGTAASLSAQILPRAVTLKSESYSKPYDGEPLTNGKGDVSVTEGSMATGEAFDYSFVGSQTVVGNIKNVFTASTSATANTANYSLTYDYGTLTVTLPAALGAGADALTPDTVKSTDRDTLKSALDEVNVYLDMSPSDEERATLNEKKARYEALLMRIEENERAEKAAADAEKAALEEKARAEKAAADAEKAALEEKARAEKLATAKAAFLGVFTGDESHLTLWLALAVLSIAAAAALIVVTRRRK